MVPDTKLLPRKTIAQPKWQQLAQSATEPCVGSAPSARHRYYANDLGRVMSRIVDKHNQLNILLSRRYTHVTKQSIGKHGNHIRVTRIATVVKSVHISGYLPGDPLQKGELARRRHMALRINLWLTGATWRCISTLVYCLVLTRNSPVSVKPVHSYACVCRSHQNTRGTWESSDQRV